MVASARIARSARRSRRVEQRAGAPWMELQHALELAQRLGGTLVAEEQLAEPLARGDVGRRTKRRCALFEGDCLAQCLDRVARPASQLGGARGQLELARAPL